MKIGKSSWKDKYGFLTLMVFGFVFGGDRG
jgi:hypothetical protein